MEKLLDKLGLYERDWLPYEKVIKMKSNDNTIFIKIEGKWQWYGEKYFDEIKSEPGVKEKLIGLLNPVNGASDEIM